VQEKKKKERKNITCIAVVRITTSDIFLRSMQQYSIVSRSVDRKGKRKRKRKERKKERKMDCIECIDILIKKRLHALQTSSTEWC